MSAIDERRHRTHRHTPLRDLVADIALDGDYEALEELLLRVRVASQRYSKYGAAWRSDRGKVYIRYGEPDRFEQRTDRTNRGEYEVWTYLAEDRTFVFYAQYAGGEDRLVEGDPF